MRTALIFGFLFSLSALPACDGTGASGDTASSLNVAPAAADTRVPACELVAHPSAIDRIAVEDLSGGTGEEPRVLVTMNGEPLCTDTLAGAAASGVLGRIGTNEVVPLGSSATGSGGSTSGIGIASSDPMPGKGNSNGSSGTDSNDTMGTSHPGK